MAKGWSNAEIAPRLFITSATAKTHLAHLLMKLDARDRAQLIVIAYESGLVTARPRLAWPRQQRVVSRSPGFGHQATG